MTTKPDHESAGAPHQVAEQTGVDARDALPSVIVDPSLNAAQLSNDAAPAANGHGEASAEPSSEPPTNEEPGNKAGPTIPEYGVSQVDLSEAEADQFADRIRPSWEPSLRASAPKVDVWNAPASSVPVASPTKPPVDGDDELPAVTQTRRGVLLTAAAIFGFVALAALSFLSSRSTKLPPKPLTHEKPSASQSAPAAPSPTVTAEPSAAPHALAANAQPAPAPAPTELAAPSAEPIAAAAQPQAAPTPAPEPALAAAPQVAALPTAEPPTQNAKAPAPTLVRIHVSTVPEDAQLTLDGAAVPNPFDTGMPRSGRHRVRAFADGYHSRDVSLQFNSDQELVLRLNKRQVAEPAPAKVARAVAPAPAPRVRSAPPPRPQATPPRSNAPTARGAGFVTESPY